MKANKVKIALLTIVLCSTSFVLGKFVAEKKHELKPKSNKVIITEQYVPTRHEKLLAAIITLESGGRPDVWGDDGKSYGLCQFQQETFEHFKKKFYMDYLNWKDPFDQVVLMDIMIRHGYGHHWTTYWKAIELVSAKGEQDARGEYSNREEN